MVNESSGIARSGGTRWPVASNMMSLTDPDGVHPLVAAMQWLQASMLGTVATAIAVIAVAGVGALMVTGRLDWRRGATVVLGCFVLFGAATIAAGIRGSSTGEEVVYHSLPPPPVPVALVPPLTPKPPPSFDPYAGAAPARFEQPMH